MLQISVKPESGLFNFIFKSVSFNQRDRRSKIEVKFVSTVDLINSSRALECQLGFWRYLRYTEYVKLANCDH